METVLSYHALSNMTISRKRLKEFRITSRYFFDNMYEHLIDHDDEIFALKEVTVKLDSGKEIPIIIDESVDEYKVIYIE